MVQLGLTADEGIADKLIVLIQHSSVALLPRSGCHDRIRCIAWLRHIAPIRLNLLDGCFKLGQLFSRCFDLCGPCTDFQLIPAQGLLEALQST
ncbi:hypothetical protein D3C73_1491720 [compost metagenome]